jgi:protein-disulfide isomerase
MFFLFTLIGLNFFYFSPATADHKGSVSTSPSGQTIIEISSTLPTVTFGSSEAPLKIVMFHSLNCGHCKEIKEKILPKIKEQFIDKGLVNLTMIDFPTNPQALNAAKVAWESRDVAAYEKISEALIADDEVWGKPDDTSEQICQLLLKKQLITEIHCQQGLNDEMLGNEILRPVFELGKDHKIDYAPAFLFNGRLKENPSILTISDIENELQKLQIK